MPHITILFTPQISYPFRVPVARSIMYSYKMPSVTAVVDTIFSSVRSIQNLFHNARCKRRAETVNEQPEIDSVPLQPEKKRRKVQSSLCVNYKYINGISDWLRSDKFTTIGIYGMGGIGKTTLAMQLYNQLQDNNISSTNIGWVSVELDFTVYQLQKNIAAAFGLDLEGDKDENRRAAMLYSFLSRTDKNCILFLDDLWSDFRHEDVGIPRNCKLIVLSRLLDVCRVLRCQKIIKVEPLTEEESWELFYCNIGGYGVLDSEEVSLLKKVVYDESAGLPFAITALADSMVGIVDDASKWTELSIGRTQTEDILNQLKLSYDRLNNIKLQHCFLYCASYPKGHAINRKELIRIWIKEGLINYVPSLKPSMEAQLDMGHSIINKLLNSSLLEACEDASSIKMHDLVRRMALLIARDCSEMKAKPEFFNLFDTIESSSTPFSKPISQPLAKQPPRVNCRAHYGCTSQHKYPPLCSDF